MSSKRKLQQDYIDPIDFNPSLYPTTSRKRRVVSSASAALLSSAASGTSASASASALNFYYNGDNDSNNNMSRRKSRSTNNWGRSSGASSGPTVNSKAVSKMFDEIAEDDDPNVATMEGICAFAEKLDIDPMEDIRILVLLQKMGANEKPAQISREEWIKGCEKLQTDSIQKFKDLLPSLDTGFMANGNEFRDFYKFAFQFNRQGTHKTLEKELVVVLVQMTLKDRLSGERLSSFVEFLNETKDTSYNRITLDQWMSFYDFSKECPDLNDYDEETSAWPVLIDDFVDFATKMQM